MTTRWENDLTGKFPPHENVQPFWYIRKKKLVILYYQNKKYAWPEIADHIKQATFYRPSATQCEAIVTSEWSPKRLDIKRGSLFVSESEKGLEMEELCLI